MDEEMREYREDDDDPSDIDDDALDQLVWEAMVEGVAASVWRAAVEDAGDERGEGEPW